MSDWMIGEQDLVTWNWGEQWSSRIEQQYWADRKKRSLDKKRPQIDLLIRTGNNCGGCRVLVGNWQIWSTQSKMVRKMPLVSLVLCVSCPDFVVFNLVLGHVLKYHTSMCSRAMNASSQNANLYHIPSWENFRWEEEIHLLKPKSFEACSGNQGSYKKIEKTSSPLRIPGRSVFENIVGWLNTAVEYHKKNPSSDTVMISLVGNCPRQWSI